jgi:hypothetical protein
LEVVAISALVVLAGTLAFLLLPGKKPLRAGAGPSITLFWGENFTGRSLTLTGTLYDLPKGTDEISDFDWNDQVRSMIVTGGTWRLYQHGRLNTLLDDTRIEDFNIAAKTPSFGWSTLVSGVSRGAVEIPELSTAGLMGDISSVELVAVENLPDWWLAMRK